MDGMIFQSAFSLAHATLPHISSAEQSRGSDVEQSQHIAGSLASFICHVAFLERKLRAQESVFVDAYSSLSKSRVRIGAGTSFRVERAEWKPRNVTDTAASAVLQRGRYIAVKVVKTDAASSLGYVLYPQSPFHELNLQRGHDQQGNWRNVLLEIRALLHPPLRYHPNIVTVLGLGWASSTEAHSVYPQLLMEFTPIGSFQALQDSSPPLAFCIKQKLCYDVGKGLLILHACGIVHGDLKHENVLVFPNRSEKKDELPFIAKIADFGGSVVDTAREKIHLLLTGTPAFAAPEASMGLCASCIKQTDVYSFGLLVWRAFIDSRISKIVPGFDKDAEELAKIELQHLKATDGLISKASDSVRSYATEHNVSSDSAELILLVLSVTVKANLEDRQLVKAQLALRGVKWVFTVPRLHFVPKINRL